MEIWLEGKELALLRSKVSKQSFFDKIKSLSLVNGGLFCEIRIAKFPNYSPECMFEQNFRQIEQLQKAFRL